MQVNHPRWRRAGATLLLAGLGLWACGSVQPGKTPPRHRLEGSVGQVMDLGYDEVRISETMDDVSVLFVRVQTLDDFLPDGGTSNTAGTIEDYPFKVALALRGQPTPVDVRVDLTEEDNNMNQRGVFSRNVRQDPRTSFPRAVRGTLYLSRPLFDDAGIPNDYVSGDFHVTFENGIEPASGRTVFGNFNAKVVQ
ncbi:MAG: hypothetical protein AB1938_18425 [Myxococcota bacterium]